ncbi:DNA damage-inducible transcript 4-like protein isoform X2 [Desmodus rotundus]|uniref:DNA damage-inducible transcript 4-like protein isoform X2 n=1 Tax=Desmodus rotundus TaxID=9430 RepID=UPI002380D400|nr:DNA damage-inducible transcript 4-like protein isoform X2 [Desmodus rotundus]
MVATGSLSSKNPGSISELVDPGFYPRSLLNDFDYWDYVVPEPNLSEVIFEETTCQSLVKMLENCLSQSKQTKLGCSKVLVPEKLTQRIAQDVLRLSSTEPCGLRGCVMHVNMEVENHPGGCYRHHCHCPHGKPAATLVHMGIPHSPTSSALHASIQHPGEHHILAAREAGKSNIWHNI